MDSISPENSPRKRTLSPEHRAAISRGMKGYVKTTEHRANLSKAHKGIPETEASKQANSRGQIGKKMSEQSKQKISEAFTGEKHWNWQGGKPKLKRYGDPRYYPWQIAVFERDNFTCQHCGYQNTHGDFLNAHHIQRWNDAPDLRFDVDNGLTLCRDCHKREHGKKPRPQETVYCACGCGNPLKPDSVAYGRRFRLGHNGRGRRRPLSERQAISAKMKGRSKSSKTRERMQSAQQKLATQLPLIE